jgi:glycosyltransferase involved in cell wall biosynthesis
MNPIVPFNSEIKVSVCMITYNQEAFISEAIESVLIQQTDFEYELVIGEDCSTDRTREIVVEYANNYPDRIRTLLHEHNMGLMGKNNLVATYHACRGKYIALLEGDDYWTDPLKLQKQVDYLETHPECALCFHNVLMIHNDKSQPDRLYNSIYQKEISNFEDLLTSYFTQTCSVMFRNGLIMKFPDVFYHVFAGDRLLFLFVSEHGFLGYINQVMSVYRIHSGGVWSPTSLFFKTSEDIKTFDKLDEYYHYRFTQLITRVKVNRIALEIYEECKAAKTHLIKEQNKFIKRCWESWLKEFPQTDHLKRKIFGVVYAHLFFTSDYSKDDPKIRYNLIQMIAYNPSWLMNRGVWSLGLEAFLGRYITGWLRKSFRVILSRK